MGMRSEARYPLRALHLFMWVKVKVEGNDPRPWKMQTHISGDHEIYEMSHSAINPSNSPFSLRPEICLIFKFNAHKIAHFLLYQSNFA